MRPNKAPCVKCGGVVITARHRYCQKCHDLIEQKFIEAYKTRYNNSKKDKYSGPCLLCGGPELYFSRRFCFPCSQLIRTKEFRHLVICKKPERICIDCGSKDLVNLNRCRDCQRLIQQCRTYGISREHLDILIAKQQNKCSICGLLSEESPINRSKGLYGLVIDHDHNTNKIRELLCRQCNTMIGIIEANTIRLERAREYLARHDNSFD